MMEFLAVHLGWYMVLFDIVAAFPHSKEQKEDVIDGVAHNWYSKY